MEQKKNFLKTLERLVHEGREIEIIQLISRFRAPDIAEVITALDEEKKGRLFGLLQIETASDVLAMLDEISMEFVVEGIPDDRLAQIVEDMPSDDAADVIAHLPEEKAQTVLEHIPREDSEEVQRLLRYKEDTAGGIMQTELISVLQDVSVSDAIDRIRALATEVENWHNVFVVDGGGKLVGVLPLRKLILCDPGTPVMKIMDPADVNVTVDVDQEEVAAIFKKYDFVSLPVVDGSGKLVGRITIDDVVDVIEEETSEDIFYMAGVEEPELVYSDRILKISGMRLPWLITNLFGGLVTGYLLWRFKLALRDVLALVTFIPVITAMGGNVGIQSSSIMVRGFAIGRVDYSNLKKVLSKEIMVGIVMGAACGAVAGSAAILWHGKPFLGVVVGLAMISAIVTASVTGTLAPALFKRFGVDPAVASGPFVTTANDIMGILIYLGMASAFLDFLV